MISGATWYQYHFFPTVLERVRKGMYLLQRASKTVGWLGESQWKHSVRLFELKTIGMCESDIRWLIDLKLIEHAWETTSIEACERTFKLEPGTVLSAVSCFILTPEGEEYANFLLGDVFPGCIQLPRVSPEEINEATLPSWDHDLRELSYQGVLIKKYRVPADNQELILSVFEECGWPTRIDDPLPPSPDMNSKRRLHNAINGLNRNRKHRLIQFRGNGNGEGIYWERIK